MTDIFLKFSLQPFAAANFTAAYTTDIKVLLYLDGEGGGGYVRFFSTVCGIPLYRQMLLS